MNEHTPGPWFMAGVRFKMNGGEWHNINRYDEVRKTDENIACVGYNVRTGLGMADARLIAAAPELLSALEACVSSMHGDHPGDNSYWRAVETAEAIIAKARGC